MLNDFSSADLQANSAKFFVCKSLKTHKARSIVFTNKTKDKMTKILSAVIRHCRQK